jgi:hypothetical protein
MPEPKDARRLIPDPENEPDFYAVSTMYPLPDDPDFEMTKPVEEADENKKRAASEPVTITRHASEASWFQKQMPPAKRPALEPDVSASMGLVPSAPVASVDKTPFPVSAVFSRGSVDAPNVCASAANGAPKISLPNGQSTQAFMANIDGIKDLMAVAGSSSNPSQFPCASSSSHVLSQLQDVINSNNQLLAAALRAQLESVPQPQQQQQHQQQFPEFASNSLTAEIIAAVLRARRGL